MVRRILKPALLALSIFAMAGVYDVMWAVRPDYFRVQSGVNFLPLDLVQIAREYSAYSDKKPLPDLLRQHGEETATKRIEDIYQKFQLASVSLVNKKAEYAKRLQQNAGEYKSFEQAQWAQYESFVAQKTAPFANQANAISGRMQNILTAAAAKSPDDLPPGPRNAYYALNIEHARAELQRAKAEAEAREYGMRHLTEFQQQTSQQAYLARYKELENLRESISDGLTATNTLHGELYDAFVHYRTVVDGQLGYWDFLYFSVGAATTATFGDISPNSTLVRMLVCLQVLGSIIFTGLMINDMASGRSKGRGVLSGS
jgi:hypothetical protein